MDALALAPMLIINTQPLTFGKFVAGSGGTLTASPAGGRSASGGVTLVPSGPGAAAQFSVSGDPNLTYAIGLPINGAVSLSSGANNMAVNNFTSTPGPTGMLGGGGTQALSVGATLSVGAGQPPGNYTGSFNVSVDYN